MTTNPPSDLKIHVAPWLNEIVADDTTGTFWLHGGLGCGKTFGLVAKHYHWILDNVDCKYSWFLEPAYHKVDTIAIPAWRDWFELIGAIEGGHYKFFRSKPQSLEVYTGLSTHRVLFQSADRPHLMVGDNIGYFSQDEAGDSKFMAFERASQRLRSKSAKYIQKSIGGVPQGLNWFAEFADFIGHSKEKDAKSFELWTKHNARNLADGYVDEQLRIFGHNKAKVESWLYGRFRSFFEGQAYPDYNPDEDRHELDADPHVPVTMSWDWNVQPLAWNSWQRRFFHDKKEPEIKFCSVGESSGKSRQITDGVSEFIIQFPPKLFKNTPIYLDGDSTGFARNPRIRGNCFTIARDALSLYYNDVTIVAPPSNPGVDIRVEYVNRTFSYGRVLIHKEDTNTSKSFVNTTWKDNIRELHKPNKDMITHWSDAGAYYIFRQIQGEESDLIKHPKVLI